MSHTMAHTIEPSNDALRGLLHKILSYEPNIYNHIMRSVFYPMKDSDELREAIKLWLEAESKALIKYGHISLWNTCQVCQNLVFCWKRQVPNVTDMSNMFNCANNFNQDIGEWDIQVFHPIYYID